MGKGCANVVLTVLLVTNLAKTGSLPGPCSACAAGTFCGKAANQTCFRCPPNSFSSKSGQKACDICRTCEGVFRTRKPCSETSNTECECVPGFRCVDAGCTQCKQDCAEGQELTQEGCKDCAFGTFYDEERGACRAWTDCSLAGKSVLAAGSKDRDVVCGPDPADFSPAAPSTTRLTPAGAPGHAPQFLVVLLLLMSTAVIILAFVLMLRLSVVRHGWKKLLDLLKQPFFSPVHTSQEEDACSCRCPEEEAGERVL
ncbi:tumor necrosis factor receptor superfamily member 9 [Sorex araneus]|uniref:tumor necrosis factor receptor superfamily member 9 n=1 Tax=Sorex araneus TaxID=42254 RepID=UPI0003318EEE|nr:tumor necrosis factor receptor superfamily member 9 [Sorex araneus]